MSSRVIRILAIAGIPLLLIAFFVFKSRRPPIEVKAYFTNALGLRPGAPVRLAGVNIGSVRTVRARPDLKQNPAEVVMTIDSTDLKLPSDSVASLQTAGVLGETFVDVDARSASGPPVANNGVLKTAVVQQVNLQQAVQKIIEALGRKPDCQPAADCTAIKRTPPAPH